MLDDLTDIHYKEMDNIINKYGSFVSMLLNKNISCVTFFSAIMEDDELKSVLIDVSECDWFDIVKHLSYRYPLLNKSKKIKK